MILLGIIYSPEVKNCIFTTRHFLHLWALAKNLNKASQKTVYLLNNFTLTCVFIIK